ncbi:GNAT family N-acetyltransferase [Pseudoduganella violacea]|uniref:GNAT superfamily N-acetyltransferase n=1 Tax=Pseudoduganella violacea TaxID=1715466 RepID=A0A7W5FTQ1_9BURK|nr:GNAT family N-acetyltransferase [Pseudoduganella violacea]MBB3119090.1 GNAT superfamily N-acetyltransferase [Pseudoduganella violacea]
MTISLHSASAADIPAMWALRTRAVRTSCVSHYAPDIIARWASTSAPDSYLRLLAQGGGLLAREGEVLLGYAILDTASGEVEAVFVAPEQGGRGVGRRLLAGLEARADALALARPLFLYAALNAVAFYEAVGFVRRRDAQYAHPAGMQLDCVYMDKA